jgi:hypothetical protein
MSYIVVVYVGQEIIMKQTPSLITTLGALICLGEPWKCYEHVYDHKLRPLVLFSISGEEWSLTHSIKWYECL